eukprot:TRINITY_DN96_c0_g1_i5.p1 TRINITY_DN96_c0_g1~~TRINITY_DN96_c0_g1_i5.p1  ORF type:complete len:224 (-),score=94.39 TRINITY_DN96_c0_g1_i5:46-669(-)
MCIRDRWYQRRVHGESVLLRQINYSGQQEDMPKQNEGAQKKQAVTKAKKAATQNKRGVTKRVHKIRTKTRFYRTNTLRLARKPLYQRFTRRIASTAGDFDRFSVIKYPLNTEKSLQRLEDQNIMTFIVDLKATKPQIREAFTKIYGGKVRNVNTLIRPDGKKKAYIRLVAETDALNIANSIGILQSCLLYTSPSPRDGLLSRMPSSA